MNYHHGTRRRQQVLFVSLIVAFLCSACTGYMFNIQDFGAATDGKTICTEAIQKAVDACGNNGGGTVVVPPGTYLTGPIFLRSHIHFHISTGATLLGHRDIQAYPTISGRGGGIEKTIYASLITGMDLENVSITGGGTLDGQGSVWWEAYEQTKKLRRRLGITRREVENPPGSQLKYERPRLINLYRCSNVLIRNLNCKNSPSWTIHPVYCRNVTVDNITIRQPFSSPNTDGVNPDSCRDVRIVNCLIDCGDDCITIKSGYNEDGRRVGIPCENVTIANCILRHGEGGIVIGSEMAGDVRNVTATNCVLEGTMRGLRIKTARGRGGIVENIRMSNIIMRDVDIAFSITKQYGHLAGPKQVNEGTPRFEDIHFSGIDVNRCGLAAEVIGLEEMPIRGLRFSDVYVDHAKQGFVCEHIDTAAMQDCTVNVKEGTSYAFRNAAELELHRVSTANPSANTPVITLENTQNVLIHGCSLPKQAGSFVRKVGSNTNVTIANNSPADASQKVEQGFIAWEELTNPIYSHPGWSTKDACMIYRNGTFYLFFSAFFEEAGRERSHVVGVKTTDFRNFSEPLFIWSGMEDGWIGMCSPDIAEHEGVYYLTYNSWGDKPGKKNQLFYAVSKDLENWRKHLPLARDITRDANGKPVRAIDAAVAFDNGRCYLVWKENQTPQAAVADQIGENGWKRLGRPDKEWFENGQFIHFDGQWHLLAKMGGDRTRLSEMAGYSTKDSNWTQWTRHRFFEMPREAFNTNERANAAFLADWRDYDGHFYLLYAGRTESKSHLGRGDNKLALSRSRDLKTWHKAGDVPAEHTSCQIRGWNILTDYPNMGKKVIQAAPDYNINHLQLSHAIVHDLQEVREDFNRKLANQLTAQAHQAGIPEVVLWDHALYDLDYYPQKFRTGPGGKIDLDNPEFWQWFHEDYREMLSLVPEIDGIVLTFIETGAHAEDQYSKIMKTEQEKLARVIDEVAKVVVEEKGLKLYVRTFIYTRSELDSMLKCLDLIKTNDIIVMVKEVPHDFFLTHPLQDYVDQIPFPVIIEFDAAHEYNGQGVIANTFAESTWKRWRYYQTLANVIGYVARTDRYKDSTIINRPSEINLYALQKLCENTSTSPEEIHNEFLVNTYEPQAAPLLKPAFQNAEEIILGGLYTLGLNTNNHSLFHFDRHSSYSRHVSGRWMDQPYITIGRNVNKRFHYYKDIINHLSPAYHKEPGSRLDKEDPFVLENGWVQAKELMNMEYLGWIVAEKDYAVDECVKALAGIQKARPHMRPEQYEDVYQTFYRTLLTVKLRRGGAKAYFGYRVYGRGPKFRSPELMQIVRTGLSELREIANRIAQYPHHYPQGGWDWKQDAEEAMEMYDKIAVHGWNKFCDHPFPLKDEETTDQINLSSFGIHSDRPGM